MRDEFRGGRNGALGTALKASTMLPSSDWMRIHIPLHLKSAADAHWIFLSIRYAINDPRALLEKQFFLKILNIGEVIIASQVMVRVKEKAVDISYVYQLCYVSTAIRPNVLIGSLNIANDAPKIASKPEAFLGSSSFADVTPHIKTTFCR